MADKAEPTGRQVRRRPQQERSQHTVAAILEATRRLLRQRPYEQVSMNQVARVAGVSVGTLYQYFGGKEALVLALSQEHSALVQRRLHEALLASRPLPLLPAVSLVLQAELTALATDAILVRQLFEHAYRIGAVEHILRSRAALFAGVQQELRLRPELRELAQEDDTTYLLIHAVDGVFQSALRFQPDRLCSPRLLRDCTELVVHHLRPCLPAAPRT